jgi:hypothetical protein
MKRVRRILILLSMVGMVLLFQVGVDLKGVFLDLNVKPMGLSSFGLLEGDPTCTDSDGGLVPDVAGYVEGIGPNGWPYKKVDVCETGDYEGYVKEFYCTSSSYSAKRFYCVNGCLEGACITETPVCTDEDGDGFSPEGGICGAIDCDDTNPAVHPGNIEICDNGIDDNCNGRIDSENPACGGLMNVIVIGWDGVQRDRFMQCYNNVLPECSSGLPNLAALDDGRVLNLTITNGDTSTKPGWAQLLTGYNAEVTGVYNNGHYQPIPEGYSVFEKLENHLGAANIVTMFISGKSEHTGGACIGDPTFKNGQPVIEDQGQPWCLTKFHLDYYENDLRQNSVVGNRAVELLEIHQNDLFFALFLFRDPDVTGHVAGVNSLSYSNAMINVDFWLGEIVYKLVELGIDDQTIIYLVSDHGFDEGANQHANAPFTIFATTDPQVIRGGDRKDLAPTILERFGVSTGPIGSSPAVDGSSLYSLPSGCIVEGQAYLDYPGAPACCTGLVVIPLHKVWNATLGVLATGGTGDQSGYCTNCGNGVCTPPENRLNCPADCQ